MSQLYTSGRWTVVPGQEEEFVTAWSEMAGWTSAEILGSSWATLLQHRETPNVFLSFGPWESAEAMAAWRESLGFKERVGVFAECWNRSSQECSTAAFRRARPE